MCAHQKPRLMLYGSQSLVDVLVVDAMAGRPPEDRVLRRHRAEDREEDLHDRRGLVALVREEAVVAGADREADRQVHADEQQRHPGMKAVRPRVRGGADDADDRA